MSSFAPTQSVTDSNPEEISQSNYFAGKILIYGVAVTALISTPEQSVFSDTIKSVAAAVFAMVSLAIMFWGLRKESCIRWSFFLLIPIGVAVMALMSTQWNPKYSALVEAGRWIIISTIILTGLNTLRKNSFPEIAKIIHWCAFFLSLIALLQFWFDFHWFPAAAAPGSTFGNRNFFAEFIAACMPFSFWVLLRKQPLKAALWKGFSIGIILVALMSTGARAALIAVFFGIAAISILLLINRHRATIFNTGTTLAITAVLPALVIISLGWIPSLNESILNEHRGNSPIERTLSRLGSLTKDDTYEDGSSFGIRLVAWQASLEMIMAHPLRGVGAGAWNANLPSYTPGIYDSDIEYVWQAHNEPLQLIAELGFMGWIALLTLGQLVISAFWRSFMKMRTREITDISEAPQEALVALSIVLMGITSLSGLPMHAPATNYILALGIAMLLAYRPHKIFGIFITKINNQKIKKFLPVFTILALATTFLISAKALSSDFYFLRGYYILSAVAKNTNPATNQAEQLQKDAVENLKYALEIYPDQGNFTGNVANLLGEIGDHSNVIWISDLMLNLRPNTTMLRCNKVIAFVELKDYKSAQEEIDKINKLKPNSSCLIFSNFILAYKKGDFSTALPIGIKLLKDEDLKKYKNEEKLRFIIESTYRSATRMSDLPTAIRMLRMRGDRWPELKAHSRLLEGLVQANISPGQISTKALDTFQEALSASRAADRSQIFQRIPEIYQKSLK